MIEEEALHPEILRSVTAELRRRQPDTWFAVEYGLEFRHEPIYKPRWDVDVPGVAEATLEEMVAEPVAKLLARHEELARDDFVALVEDVIGDRATVTHSSSDALAEISAAGVTKASGLAKVAAQHGVGPEDVVVFGDMPNDIAAFDWVREAGGPGGRDGPRAPRPPGRRDRRHRHQRRRRGRRVPAVPLSDTRTTAPDRPIRPLDCRFKIRRTRRVSYREKSRTWIRRTNSTSQRPGAGGASVSGRGCSAILKQTPTNQ